MVDSFTMDNLDDGVFDQYKKAVGFAGTDLVQLLTARGFARSEGGTVKMTVAGVLLFAAHPTRFLPSARLRFLRFL